jgi:Rrf2 family protein
VRLTRQGDYAVRVMVDLAAHPDAAPVPRARIQARQDVPPAYLAKIVQALARAGLVRTLPGAGGGVRLGQPADAITLRDIVEAVEGPIELNRCAARPGACPRDAFCPVHPVWRRVQEVVTRELDAVTLAALVATPAAAGPPDREARAC